MTQTISRRRWLHSEAVMKACVQKWVRMKENKRVNLGRSNIMFVLLKSQAVISCQFIRTPSEGVNLLCVWQLASISYHKLHLNEKYCGGIVQVSQRCLLSPVLQINMLVTFLIIALFKWILFLWCDEWRRAPWRTFCSHFEFPCQETNASILKVRASWHLASSWYLSLKSHAHT